MLKPRPKREDFDIGHDREEINWTKFYRADLAWHKEALRVVVEALTAISRHTDGHSAQSTAIRTLQSIKGEANE